MWFHVWKHSHNFFSFSVSHISVQVKLPIIVIMIPILTQKGHFNSHFREHRGLLEL